MKPRFAVFFLFVFATLLSAQVFGKTIKLEGKPAWALLRAFPKELHDPYDHIYVETADDLDCRAKTVVPGLTSYSCTMENRYGGGVEVKDLEAQKLFEALPRDLIIHRPGVIIKYALVTSCSTFRVNEHGGFAAECSIDY